MQLPGPEDQGLGKLVKGCPLTTVEPATPQEVPDSVPPDRPNMLGPNEMGKAMGSALLDRTHCSLPTVMGPLVPDVGIPATCYKRALAAPLQPVLPFRPASLAAQSLEDNRLGQGHVMDSRYAQVDRLTSWFTVFTLHPTGNPPSMAAIPGEVHQCQHI